jgi:hypothetical protein
MTAVGTLGLSPQEVRVDTAAAIPVDGTHSSGGGIASAGWLFARRDARHAHAP